MTLISRMSRLCLFSIIFFLQAIYVSAQSDVSDPSFTTFEGTVYKMPKILQKINGHLTKTILERYDDKVYSYDSLTAIRIEEINIKETYIKYGSFPSVPVKTKFCMLLKSEMTIEEDGQYTFSLNSDDGSILWVNDVEVVNNDGGHPMRFKSEIAEFKAGTYPIKLWYFQGHPDRFGFQFDAQYYGPILKMEPTVVNLQSELLFEYRSSSLTYSAEKSIDVLIENIDSKDIQSIEIIGHTDNIGSAEYNQNLSLARANNVADYIRKEIVSNTIEIITQGVGETSPITQNDTEINRSKNRRVEIRFHY